MNTRALFVTVLALAWLGACQDNEVPQAPVRPVRAVVVEQRIVSEPVMMLGQIRAQDDISLAFRIDGKMVERLVNVGDHVTTGQVVARIDQQNEQTSLRAAEADIAAAQAALAQATKSESRQAELLKRGSTSQALYDQALQQFLTTEAQLAAAKARQQTAQIRLKFTELLAEVAGTVTAKGAEPGEVVRPGQMILRVAREDLKDAVFEVPAQLMTMKQFPRDPIVEIALTYNPSIKASGRVREVAPQADPSTRLFPIKVTLIDAPAEMLPGMTVTGSILLNSPPVITVPITALTESDGKPAVWVIDPSSSAVELRRIEFVRFNASLVIVSNGLKDGEVVVTAGVNVLYPGQKVKLLAGAS